LETEQTFATIFLSYPPIFCLFSSINNVTLPEKIKSLAKKTGGVFILFEGSAFVALGQEMDLDKTMRSGHLVKTAIK